MSSVWRDLVLAARSLSQARAFTVVCVITLGFGMAPSLAIQYGMRVFSTPPPGVDTAGLVEIVTTRAGDHEPTTQWSYPDFSDLSTAATGLTLTGFALGERTVTLPDTQADVGVDTMYVSPNYFRTIGVTLARGTGFPEAPAADPMVIVGYRFWQRRLAGDPGVIGTTLTVNGVPHIVVGIAPDGFIGHIAVEDRELFLPLERHPVFLASANARFDRSKSLVRIEGRLSPGVSVAQASAAVSAVTAQLARDQPSTNQFRAGVAEAYRPLGVLGGRELGPVLTLFSTLAAIPMVLIGLNVSGMVQVRSAMRERELSIRQAIGASRGRLMRYLMAETFVLAALGAALASIVLFNLPAILSLLLDDPLPAFLDSALRVDLLMLAKCAGVSLAACLICGWLPALRFSRPAIMTVLKDESGTGGIRAGRVHRVTTAVQMAIAVPALVVSFTSLERVRATASADLGFAADRVYAAPLDMPAGTNSGSLIRRVRDTLAAANGVTSVTVADGLPLDFRYRLARVSTETSANTVPTAISAQVTRVGDDYLETMEIALRRGRKFTAEDTAGAPMVAIISNALAIALFPDGEALGQRVVYGTPGGEHMPPRFLTVVGVTDDFPTAQMSTRREQLLLPLAQQWDAIGQPPGNHVNDVGPILLIARSDAGEPAPKLVAALENTLREVDPLFDRAKIVTGASLRKQSEDDFLEHFGAGALGGGAALLLTALGIYGVVGLMVSTRTRELAVRMMLGASRRQVIGMILFDVVKLVGPGVVAGLVIYYVFALRDGGVTISPAEPLAYAAGALIATFTAVLAALAPARRAASVPPMSAMRST
jgi:predicted permease